MTNLAHGSNERDIKNLCITPLAKEELNVGQHPFHGLATFTDRLLLHFCEHAFQPIEMLAAIGKAAFQEPFEFRGERRQNQVWHRVGELEFGSVKELQALHRQSVRGIQFHMIS